MLKKETKNLEFDFIKSQFEHKSYYTRYEFMNNYLFNDNYQNYYINYISDNVFKIKSNAYLSDLVCFTLDFEIFCSKISKIWFKLLETNNSLVLNLSILDYFNGCPLNKLPKNYELKLLELSKTKHLTFLRNQIYFNLVSYNEENKFYLESLINSIKKTNDYRVILRIESGLFLLNSSKIKKIIKKELLNKQQLKSKC